MNWNSRTGVLNTLYVNPNIFGGDRGAEGADGGGMWGDFFLILDFKMAICGEFLVQCLAVQLKL